MVNHARTLLCNMRPGDIPLGILGEEHIPEDFSPVPLPQSVIDVRKAIFGSDPDRVFMNYRAAELMRVLHSTEFADYVLSFDTRIAYSLDNKLFDLPTGNTIEAITQPPGIVPAVLGQVSADERLGRCFHQWDVKLAAPTIEIARISKNPQSRTFAWQTDGGLSVRYPLSGTSLEVRFAVSEPPGDGWWRITSLSRPGGFADLERNLRGIGQEAFINIFSSSEPYLTFRNLWERHRLWNYRLTGLLLAAIWRAEERRTG